MDLTMMITADYANLDASGKLNILGGFRRIFTSAFPVKHPLMHLVVQFRPSLGEYGDTRKVRVKLVEEDGKELFHIVQPFEIPAVVKGKQPDIAFILGMRDIEFPHSGRYEFRVYIDKDQKGEYAIDVEQFKTTEE